MGSNNNNNNASAVADDDLFSGGFVSAAPATPAPKKVFDEEGLRVDFVVNSNNALTDVTATVTNNNGATIENFDFQVAVPKFLKLSMTQVNTQTIPSAGTAKLTLSLENSQHGNKKVMIRVRLSYTIDGKKVVKMAQLADCFQ